MYLLIHPSYSIQPFLKTPEEKKNKIRETCICLWSLSATQYVLSRLVKGNTFFLMGHKNSPFPAVCESCIPIWYYIYDAWKKLTVLHLLCRVLWVAQTVQKLRLWQRTSLRIFSLCGCLFEFLSMPPWNLPLSHCERVYLPGADWAGLWVVAPEWVSTRGPPFFSFFFFFHQTRMCAHIWANPLISPPGLLSISDGSRAVGDDDCWQDLDYWGEDDGSSCSDRIAVTPDPLEGLIRLLWKLLLLDLQQPGRYS